MYWLLSSVPLILGVLSELYSILGGFSDFNNTRNTFVIIWVLLLSPIYLLIINSIYINRGVVTYLTGALYILSIIAVRVGIRLLFYKIQFGTFVGDVPEVIYYWLFGIPATISIIGMIILYTKHRFTL